MKRILVLVFMFITVLAQAQNISEAQLKSLKVDDLSDAQISQYWERAKEEGYSLSQLEIIAKAKGMSASEFAKLRSRINGLSSSSSTVTSNEIEDLPQSNLVQFGLTSDQVVEEKSSPIYGMDFFNNPNVNFVPNLNVATPDSYQVGPGDQLLIDVWGASEASYQLNVERSGAIRIDRIGPIYVSGLTMKQASNKVINYLKKIYRGIDASVGDVTKTYASVSLAQARTVQVNIIGEVAVPGTYNLSAMSTVMNALYASGGPTAMGSFRAIELVRNGKVVETFDIYEYLKKGIINNDLVLRDQDVIIVPAFTNQVNIIGEVKRPGIYELTNKETIKDLMWYANGFTAEANQSHIAISRYNGKERELLDLNYLEHTELSLQNGDQVNVARVVDRFTNKVAIEGAVYSPGDFEFEEGLDLKTLILKANGLRDYAYLKRGL
ncbi:SLBB domain-containing protein, partial [Flavobacteriaceae bacterium]|nr:SLBB domain-containing protein [Flavobacteriaceae bacterium]